MKQIFNTSRGIGAFEVPIPTPSDNELLVAVHSSVISTGTETMGMRKGDKTLSEKLHEKIELWGKVTQVIKEKGLNRAIEVVKNRHTKEPAAPFGGSSPEMSALHQFLLDNGVYLSTHWNIILLIPPLIITQAQLAEGMSLIDQALNITDKAVTN